MKSDNKGFGSMLRNIGSRMSQTCGVVFRISIKSLWVWGKIVVAQSNYFEE